MANLTSALDFHSRALVVRAERQRVLASNIANSDTPGYVARDINFREAMSQANTGLTLAASPSTSALTSNPQHIALSSSANSPGNLRMGYSVQSQPSADGNSVDMDRERANFVDNAVHYEATLRFINGQSRMILSAIQGQ